MYQFIQLDKSHYSKIINLFLLCFNKKFLLSNLIKKYDTLLFGIDSVGFIAVNEFKEICANYCVFPIILNYKSKDFLIAQSGDTMTSPKHRKRGLFVKLANKTYLLAEKLGIQLIYGFPNENSFYGFKNNLNWIFYGKMQRFLIKTKAIPICELCSKIGFIKPFYDSYVNKKLNKYKINVETIDFKIFNFNKNKGMIKRDLNFFKYKLRSNTNYLIQMNDFFIFLKTETHLIIGDIGIIEKHEGEKLLKTLNELAVLLHCKKIILDLSVNHWLYEILNNLITPIDSLPIGFKIFNQDILPQEIQFSKADFDTF